MYSVLLRILPTDKGRALVREYDQDPQKIPYEFHEHQTNSETARNEVSCLTTYITSLRLTDAWNGTTRQFFMHFKESSDLESLAQVHEQFPQSTRITFLSQVVEAVPDLRRVKTVEIVMRVWLDHSNHLTSRPTFNCSIMLLVLMQSKMESGNVKHIYIAFMMTLRKIALLPIIKMMLDMIHIMSTRCCTKCSLPTSSQTNLPLKPSFPSLKSYRTSSLMKTGG